MEESQRQNPSWVSSLLTGKFFVPCLSHGDAKKNERNVFCLDCCAPICSHCCHHHLHHAHRLLQVRRYVYQDVVRLEDFSKMFDCSLIQSYTTNSAKVVFLNQRPQSRPLKGSGSLCSSCERALQQPYHFCCLACKVEYLVRHEGCAPVRFGSRRGDGGWSRRPGPPVLRGGEVEDGQMTPVAVLDGGACLRASSGSSGGNGQWAAGGGAVRCTATTEGFVTRKKRTRAVAAAATGAAGAGIFRPSRNAPGRPHLPCFKRKGVPTRSPFY